MKAPMLLSLMISLSAWSAIDSGTRDVLIKKFEKVYMQMSPSSEARVPVTLRLADLHSERARNLSMQELEMGCTICNAGKKDRLSALKYYTEVLTKIPSYQRPKVLAQMGHLYELTDQVAKAQEFYQSIIDSDGVDADMRSEAMFSLAEIAFKRNRYELALSYYNQVLENTTYNRRGLATYRKAWSLFNTDQVRPAIETLIKMIETPALLTRGSAGGVISVDQNFKDEVSRDLATFFAKGGRGLADAKMLYEKSSDRVKLENVTYFANELQRLGEKAKAISVWKYVQEIQPDPAKRLEGWIHLAQLQLDAGQRPASVAHYKKALDMWSRVDDCDTNESCKEWKSRLRKYLLDWNRTEKDNPTDMLLDAYRAYLATFPNELDMTVYASLVARKQQKWPEAYRLTQAAVGIGGGGKDLPDHESLLLSMIEIGELAKDEAMLVESYNYYLESSKTRTRAVDVQYQLAYLTYKSGDYAKASNELKAVALIEGTQGQDIKLKAADLALDSLALLKNDASIETWSAEFSAAFPERQAEYGKLARTAVFNQAAGQTDDLNASWAIMQRFDLNSASEDEKIKFYKNKLVLAEKLKKYAEIKLAANKLLEFKNLKPEDRKLALSRKSWVAELELDFPTAYASFKQIKDVKLDPGARLLKLALFSELAGQDPSKYYRSYLKVEKDGAKLAEASWNIVKRSKSPIQALKKYERHLIQDKSRLAQKYFEMYLSGQAKAGKYLTRHKTLKTTSVAKSIWREQFLARVDKFATQLSTHQIDQGKRLARTIRKRDQLLKKGEKLLKEAAQVQDWTAQVVCLDLLAKESDRFYQELLSLPMPEGLTADEQGQYLQLLSQQASPHEIRAQEAKAKFEEFWSQVDLFIHLEKQYQEKRGQERQFFAKELERLIGLAPELKKPELAKVLEIPETPVQTPTLRELQTAKAEVRRDPDNLVKLEKLKSLEMQMKNLPMVAYIDTRIRALRGNNE